MERSLRDKNKCRMRSPRLDSTKGPYNCRYRRERLSNMMDERI
jgi:hypothetical protein